ncbi:MAG: hypothetical protein LBV08_01730 [Clostridiales bacterium]|jgi:spore germination protein YaaH|nr:hypothetical protein [Clostridiales bacterium]
MKRKSSLFAALIISISFSTPAYAYNMSYLYGGTPYQYNNYIERASDVLDSVSPEFFQLKPDGSLSTNNIDKSFIDNMHSKNIDVIPFLTNNSNRSLGVSALNNYRGLAVEIANAIEEYGLDGINIDLSNITENNKKDFSDFLKETRLHIGGKTLIVSVAANPEGKNAGYYGLYDYEEIAGNSDYVLLTCFDESNQSTEPGPASGLDFITKSIENLVKHVPSEKIILGIPLYGRFWQKGEQSGGNNITNMDIESLVNNYKIEKITANDDKTEKLILTIEENDVKPRIWGGHTLEAGEYEIYYDNEYAIKEKIDTANQYNLKGIAAWSLGQESKSVWKAFGSSNYKLADELVEAENDITPVLISLTGNFNTDDFINNSEYAEKVLKSWKTEDRFDEDNNRSRIETITIETRDDNYKDNSNSNSNNLGNAIELGQDNFKNNLGSNSSYGTSDNITGGTNTGSYNAGQNTSLPNASNFDNFGTLSNDYTTPNSQSTNMNNNSNTGTSSYGTGATTSPNAYTNPAGNAGYNTNSAGTNNTGASNSPNTLTNTTESPSINNTNNTGTNNTSTNNSINTPGNNNLNTATDLINSTTTNNINNNRGTNGAMPTGNTGIGNDTGNTPYSSLGNNIYAMSGDNNPQNNTISDIDNVQPGFLEDNKSIASLNPSPSTRAVENGPSTGPIIASGDKNALNSNAVDTTADDKNQLSNSTGGQQANTLESSPSTESSGRLEDISEIKNVMIEENYITENEYYANDILTRGQFLKTIMRMAPELNETPNTFYFSGLTGYEGGELIEKARYYGIAPSDSIELNPEENITKAEVILTLEKLFDLPNTVNFHNDTVKDINKHENSDLYYSVNKYYELGLVDIDETNNFNPKSFISTNEFLQIAYKLKDVSVKKLAPNLYGNNDANTKILSPR